MAAPYTQVFIQSKIDFFAAQMEKAATAQKYTYEQGPIGQVGVEKGDLAQTQRSLEFWIGQMEKWYPDAFATQPQVYFTEINYISG